MFGIGFVELCVIVIVALVFVGPKKLPDMMRQMGKFFVQIRRMTSDVKNTMDDVIRDAEKEIQKDELDKIRDLLPKMADLTKGDVNLSQNTPRPIEKGHQDNLKDSGVEKSETFSRPDPASSLLNPQKQEADLHDPSHHSEADLHDPSHHSEADLHDPSHHSEADLHDPSHHSEADLHDPSHQDAPIGSKSVKAVSDEKRPAPKKPSFDSDLGLDSVSEAKSQDETKTSSS